LALFTGERQSSKSIFVRHVDEGTCIDEQLHAVGLAKLGGAMQRSEAISVDSSGLTPG
jgi:hypothetical protein